MSPHPIRDTLRSLYRYRVSIGRRLVFNILSDETNYRHALHTLVVAVIGLVRERVKP